MDIRIAKDSKHSKDVSLDHRPELYLQPSKYTNCQNHLIEEHARKITENASDDKEKSVQLFNWVRDEVKYVLGLYGHTSTETLLTKSGSCSNKANLMVSLLRNLGVPASFNIIKVHTRKYLGPVCTHRFAKFMNEASYHVYLSVFLNNAWIQCDPTDDAVFSVRTAHFNAPSAPVVFNGEKNANLKIDESYIIERTIHLDNIDFIFDKKRRVNEPVLFTMNLYMDFMRENGHKYLNIARMEDDFFNWFKSECPEKYQKFIYEEIKLESDVIQVNPMKVNQFNTNRMQK